MIAVSKRSKKQIMNKINRVRSCVFTALFLSGSVQAQERFAPEQVGMGGAGIARTDSMGFRNAAAMMLEPGLYSITETRWGQGFFVSSALREVRLDSAVGASLGYSWGRSDLPPTDAERPGWQLPDEVLTNQKGSSELFGAGGVRLVEGRLGLGAGFHYLRQQSELGGRETALDMDVSLAAWLAEGVSLAAAARGVLSDEMDPFSIEVGLYWSSLESVRLALDAVYVDEEAEGRVGLDVGLSASFRARAGYAFSEQNGRVGAGFGLLGEGSRIDYAWSRGTTGVDEGVVTHSLAVFVAVPSKGR